MQKKIDLSLYVITDRLLSRGRPPMAVAAKAIAGGATCIQLREKDAAVTSRELFALAEKLRALTREKGVALIINDRLDIALAVGADGVHLGRDDLPLAVARRLLPPGMILGASAGDPRQSRRAQAAGAAYLGTGAVFGTSTKPDAGAAIGLAALNAVCRSVEIPVVGIGGITAANAGRVIAAGAAGAAVISSVVGAADVTAAAREIALQVKTALARRNTGGNI
ncbi:MAG: thiamine phosphate synthase [Firmicutes bacterium]|nr:thiamine phosphate synthase [Bacillota bacterium]